MDKDGVHTLYQTGALYPPPVHPCLLGPFVVSRAVQVQPPWAWHVEASTHARYCSYLCSDGGRLNTEIPCCSNLFADNVPATVASSSVPILHLY